MPANFFIKNGHEATLNCLSAQTAAIGCAWYLCCSAVAMMNAEANKAFLDYLEECADLHRLCHIRFRSVEGALSEISAHLVRLFHEGDRPIVETDAGFSIGVVQLESVNGRNAAYFC